MKGRVRWGDGRILEIKEKGMLLMDLKCARTGATQAVRMLCWAAPSMEMPLLAVQAFTAEGITVAFKPTGATVDFSKQGGVVMGLDEQSMMQATIHMPGDQIPPRHYPVPMGQPSSAGKGYAAYTTTAKPQGGYGGRGFNGSATTRGRGFTRGTTGRGNQGGRGVQSRAPSQPIFDRLGKRTQADLHPNA